MVKFAALILCLFLQGCFTTGMEIQMDKRLETFRAEWHDQKLELGQVAGHAQKQIDALLDTAAERLSKVDRELSQLQSDLDALPAWGELAGWLLGLLGLGGGAVALKRRRNHATG